MPTSQIYSVLTKMKAGIRDIFRVVIEFFDSVFMRCKKVLLPNCEEERRKVFQKI